MNQLRFFAALYVSEGWYSAWLTRKDRPHYRARAVVIFDRIMAGEDHRLGGGAQ